MLFQLVLGGFSGLINQNNQNSNWKKILVFRNLQEKLEKCFFFYKSSSTILQPACKDFKNVSRSPMLLLKTTATSSMKVCCGKETKQILQSALHSLRNTRSSSRFDLAASPFPQITNPFSRKLSRKFQNLIGTGKSWGLRNLAGSRCRIS